MIPTVARAAVLALAATVMVAAGASGAASQEPGTLGLVLSPAPLHVDDGDLALTAYNRSGGLELDVTLTPSEGYAVSPETFTLAVDGTQLVQVTAVDPEADGTLAALATADVDGAVRAAIALETRFLHATWFEKNPAAIPAAILLAAIGGLLILALVRRRVPR